MHSDPLQARYKLADSFGSVRCCLNFGFCCLVVILISAVGCRVTQVWNDQSIPQISQPQTLTEVETESRTPISIPFIDPDERGELARDSPTIEPLGLRECEFMAAQNAPLARILEQETASGPCECRDVDSTVQNSINVAINANASYQRNAAAEKALLAYFGLVEVHLQSQVSRESLEEITKLQEVLAQLQAEGLVREIDPESLVREILSLKNKQAELVFNQNDLNQKLRLLLGLADSSTPIWTDCRIDGWVAPADLQAEIDLAMQNRSDIAALRSFIQCGSDDLLEMMRSSVRSVSPLAAIAIQRRLFGGLCKDNSAEIQKLRMQLAILLESQIALVKSEVTESFHAIQKYVKQIELNRQKLESLRKSENRLGARRQVGAIKIDEVLTIKSQILQTRAEQIHSAIQLQMEWIKLKSRQGMLGGNQSAEVQSPESQTTQQELMAPQTASEKGVPPVSSGNLTRSAKQLLQRPRLNAPAVTKASYHRTKVAIPRTTANSNIGPAYNARDLDQPTQSSLLDRIRRFELAPLR